MEPTYIPNTAFTCYKGLFELVRMPFDLKSSPSSFQCLMDIVLDEVRYKFVMHDALMVSRSFEEHLGHLTIVLPKMQISGLTMETKKFQSADSKTNLHGFIVDDGQLRPNHAKFRIIADYPCLRGINSCQRFWE